MQSLLAASTQTHCQIEGIVHHALLRAGSKGNYIHIYLLEQGSRRRVRTFKEHILEHQHTHRPTQTTKSDKNLGKVDDSSLRESGRLDMVLTRVAGTHSTLWGGMCPWYNEPHGDHKVQYGSEDVGLHVVC